MSVNNHTFAQRRLSKDIEKYLKKKLNKLPDNALAGTRLDDWIKHTLKGNPKFDTVEEVIMVEGEDGLHKLSITFKQGE